MLPSDGITYQVCEGQKSQIGEFHVSATDIYYVEFKVIFRYEDGNQDFDERPSKIR